jgi:large subunit ribosomal protein L30
MLRIKLVRSPIAHNKRNRATVEALGLSKMNQVKELPDNPAVRGMVFKVKELLEIEVPEGTPAIPDARSNPRLGHDVRKGITPPSAHRKH